jgi:uncharacterized protein
MSYENQETFMDIGAVLSSNLLSPLVLAFVLGMIATLVKSDVEFPEPVYKFMSIYLLFSIGINGGVDLAGVALADFALPALTAVLLAVATPAWCYWILRRAGRFDPANAAGIAAHYGSVSSVTFIAAMSLTEVLGIAVEGFLPSMIALMEWGIIVALLIGRAATRRKDMPLSAVMRDALTGRSVILLMGGLVIGAVIGEQGYAAVKPVFGDLFRGVLVLFLLEMGMVAARQLRGFMRVGLFMTAFAIMMPLIHGAIGVVLGTLVGLSPGGAFVLGAVTASASYIDAPAAVRSALPQANPSIYLTASLGITLPFNLTIGLPIYYELARWAH